MSSHDLRPGSSSHSAGLYLRVHRLNGRCDEVYIAAGLSIGRSVANTVQLDGDESICRTHARVNLSDDGSAWLRCVDPGSVIMVGDETVRELPLKPQCKFSIGRFQFECLAGQHVRSHTPAPLVPECPLCGSTDVSTAGAGSRRTRKRFGWDFGMGKPP